MLATLQNEVHNITKFSPKNKKNLGMAYRTPPVKKVKKQGEMPLPILGPIPSKKCRFRD